MEFNDDRNFIPNTLRTSQVVCSRIHVSYSCYNLNVSIWFAQNSICYQATPETLKYTPIFDTQFGIFINMKDLMATSVAWPQLFWLWFPIWDFLHHMNKSITVYITLYQTHQPTMAQKHWNPRRCTRSIGCRCKFGALSAKDFPRGHCRFGCWLGC